VALVRTEVSEKRVASVINVERIRELRMTLAVTNNILRSVFLLLVPANIVPSSLMLFTLMMEAVRPTKTSVVTRATYRHIPEDGILHSRHRENLKSYIKLTGWHL
jgi:hypothetical protein